MNYQGFHFSEILVPYYMEEGLDINAYDDLTGKVQAMIEIEREIPLLETHTQYLRFRSYNGKMQKVEVNQTRTYLGYLEHFTKEELEEFRKVLLVYQLEMKYIPIREFQNLSAFQIDKSVLEAARVLQKKL